MWRIQYVHFQIKEAKRENAMSNIVLAQVLIRVLKVTGISLLAFSESARFGVFFYFSLKKNFSLIHY